MHLANIIDIPSSGEDNRRRSTRVRKAGSRRETLTKSSGDDTESSSSGEDNRRRSTRVRKAGSRRETLTVCESSGDGDDTNPSSTTKSGSGASQGDVVCSGSKDQAISKTKSFLSTVHVGGIFRIENSKTDPYPYFYMVCKLCRDAKCGMWVKPGAGSTWTIKSVTTALGTACAGRQISSCTSAVAPQVEQHRAGA
jgi:hypothetical protein